MRIVAYSPYRLVSWSTQWHETKSTSLRSQIEKIVEVIETAAPELVAKLEEGEREAEIRHQQWLTAEEHRRKEEDRKHIERSISTAQPSPPPAVPSVVTPPPDLFNNVSNLFNHFN
jgi:hypothetical protein